MAGGHVRIILTTNFDGLIETALRQAGIEPTVVAHRDDVAGMAPLHTLKCLVVHVHGYYLNATSMLNTPEELDAYDTATDALLDRIFDDYGLVIAGWSATWDPALRNALSRCSRHVFASYWTDPYPLPDVARDVLAGGARPTSRPMRTPSSARSPTRSTPSPKPSGATQPASPSRSRPRSAPCPVHGRRSPFTTRCAGSPAASLPSLCGSTAPGTTRTSQPSTGEGSVC
ncbi:SIR2 family protein [Streptomyces griseobrunneus]|uniref:SIR2 family protein n=1 Tax=Streptomyces microflavus TaxID=1919 RepID=UPI0037F9E060